LPGLSESDSFVSVEVEDGKRMAEGLINQLTGGDTVAARFLYSEAFEFRPQFKLWLAANNRPSISGPEGAIWRRLVQIPFLEQIPEDERDPEVKARLRDAERSAVLAWLVQGVPTVAGRRLKGAGSRQEVDRGISRGKRPVKGFLRRLLRIESDCSSG